MRTADPSALQKLTKDQQIKLSSPLYATQGKILDPVKPAVSEANMLQALQKEGFEVSGLTSSRILKKGAGIQTQKIIITDPATNTPVTMEYEISPPDSPKQFRNYVKSGQYERDSNRFWIETMMSQQKPGCNQLGIVGMKHVLDPKQPEIGLGQMFPSIYFRSTPFFQQLERSHPRNTPWLVGQTNPRTTGAVEEFLVPYPSFVKTGG